MKDDDMPKRLPSVPGLLHQSTSVLALIIGVVLAFGATWGISATLKKLGAAESKLAEAEGRITELSGHADTLEDSLKTLQTTIGSVEQKAGVLLTLLAHYDSDDKRAKLASLLDALKDAQTPADVCDTFAQELAALNARMSDVVHYENRVSLRSVNFPTMWVRHKSSGLRIDPNSSDALFLADATFVIEAPKQP
jgi:hypothetical protein